MIAADLSRKRIILILSAIMLGVLMSALDSTIVGTAMPAIIQDLKGMEHYSWPFTSYMLLSTIGIPIFGKLADIFGRKIIYAVGILTFLLSSVLCGFSHNMIQLIFFRGLQGLGGGILISNAFAIIGELYPPRERGKYTGYLASMFGLASVVGPSIGGFITDLLNWRWVFYVNIPLALAALIIVLLALPRAIEHTTERSVDFIGIAALIAAFAPMLLAFSWAGRDYAWLSPQIAGLFGFSTIMLVLFFSIEGKVKEPIIPLYLFRNRTFNISIVASFMSNAAMFGAIIFIPLYVQGVRGSSASRSGIITTPLMLTLIITSIVSGLVVSRTGKYKKLSVSAFLIAMLGMYLLSTLTPYSPNWLLVSYMIILGVGLGINIPIFNIIVQSAFPIRQMGVTTAGVQFFKNIGGTIGSAVFGSVMLANIARGIEMINWNGAPAAYVEKLKDPKLLSNPIAMKGIRAGMPPAAWAFFDEILRQVKGILAHSIHQVFLIAMVVVVIALTATLCLKDTSLDSLQEGIPEQDTGKQ